MTKSKIIGQSYPKALYAGSCYQHGMFLISRLYRQICLTEFVRCIFPNRPLVLISIQHQNQQQNSRSQNYKRKQNILYLHDLDFQKKASTNEIKARKKIFCFLQKPAWRNTKVLEPSGTRKVVLFFIVISFEQPLSTAYSYSRFLSACKTICIRSPYLCCVLGHSLNRTRDGSLFYYLFHASTTAVASATKFSLEY